MGSIANEHTLRTERSAETIHQLSVVVARGIDAGKKIDLAPGESAQIGTADDNDLVLSDPRVSRYHVELSPGENGISVRDLESLNGTFVGATRVHGGVVTRGAQLRLGDTVLVVDAAESARTTEESPSIAGLVYQSARMRELARAIVRLSQFPGAVLIQGETGTGKELVAAGLHDKSPRKSAPFVIVDCGALQSSLVASELFGHERGAFTGADKRAIGAFERAQGGTIFLDEIGELPLSVQPTLLGALQRKKVRRLGGDKDIAIDVRVVSATHRDLRGDVNRGTFREDLYYRIAGARIVVPPLRDRAEDVPILVRHFVEEMTGSTELPVRVADLIHAFSTQSWPGNVRELRSAVERALFLVDPIESLATDGSGGDQVAPKNGVDGAGAPIARYRDARARVIAAFEASFVETLMASVNGNASEAARRAGMDRPYLLSLLKKHGLR